MEVTLKNKANKAEVEPQFKEQNTNFCPKKNLVKLTYDNTSHINISVGSKRGSYSTK